MSVSFVYETIKVGLLSLYWNWSLLIVTHIHWLYHVTHTLMFWLLKNGENVLTLRNLKWSCMLVLERGCTDKSEHQKSAILQFGLKFFYTVTLLAATVVSLTANWTLNCNNLRRWGNTSQTHTHCRKGGLHLFLLVSQAKPNQPGFRKIIHWKVGLIGSDHRLCYVV